MKQVILLILCLTTCSTFFVACKKDNAKTTLVNMASISGTWELRQAQTENIPAINYPAGNSNILKFTDTGYSTFSNGSLIKSGRYTLTPDTTAGTNVCLVLSANEYKNRIIFDGDYASAKTFVQVTNDTATFISGCFAVDSGYYYVYKKQ
jgi:hypothetical protein